MYRDEKIYLVSLLEIEKDKHRLTNTTLTEKLLKLCEQQLKVEKVKGRKGENLPLKGSGLLN